MIHIPDYLHIYARLFRPYLLMKQSLRRSYDLAQQGQHPCPSKPIAKPDGDANKYSSIRMVGCLVVQILVLKASHMERCSAYRYVNALLSSSEMANLV